MKIVAIGGGHGLSRVLRAMAPYPHDLTAIIATTDNGGSTGKLRQTFGGIAYGDIRNCLSNLVADDHLGKLLLDYRFDHDSDLDGHNLGNLMLLALDNLCVRPSDAIEVLCRLMDVKQTLLPMSDHPTQLMARFANGQQLMGETTVDDASSLPTALKLHPSVEAPSAAVDALMQAERILIGPGSLLTSLAPPCLVPEIQRAINRSQARTILISNLAAESGCVGDLSPERQQQLFETLTGVQIDHLLSHSKDAFDKPNHWHRPLLAEQQRYHCPIRLGKALQELCLR
ncbi:uridine diphosphate-N-acetylglucosamine-binding protein YvcK [Ferrimonas sp. SCSIO 43195]|uniref:gluconeogenesis factor YvcK family protein n=1 Tax=Ferrimonas sp. SCSIO 43195 TaxID=2822844 RepID=UPI0020763D78|nr:uridine diphosphate-N-acetylglucosamine-binding protein YvcK [Ferrimonas sp. SCSIO 43195]USD35701.1 YvcK family protein [Ferrimonas sp. SCSIO 43195]